MEPDFLYFAFGANLDEATLRRSCPSARLVTIARLPDHRLAFTVESPRTWHGGVGDILPAPQHEVWGAVWIIDGAESHELDTQEGLFRDPPVYRRYEVALETPAGDRIPCRSYQVVAPRIDDVAPSPRYKQTILRGARACGLPPAYLARLELLPDNGYIEPPAAP